VETPTTIMGMLHFASGADVNIFMSWDVWKHGHPAIELYGTEGTLRVPDPNFFGGSLQYSKGRDEWITVDASDRAFGRPNYRAAMWPATQPSQANYRCLGIAELAASVTRGTPHRASGAMGSHSLEAMQSVIRSGRDGGRIVLDSKIDRPASLPEDEAAKLWEGGWR
jgi:predicted dehydrogenase